jgi:uncharacterized Zn-finger protein
MLHRIADCCLGVALAPEADHNRKRPKFESEVSAGSSYSQGSTGSTSVPTSALPIGRARMDSVSSAGNQAGGGRQGSPPILMHSTSSSSTFQHSPGLLNGASSPTEGQLRHGQAYAGPVSEQRQIGAIRTEAPGDRRAGYPEDMSRRFQSYGKLTFDLR